MGLNMKCPNKTNETYAGPFCEFCDVDSKNIFFCRRKIFVSKKNYSTDCSCDALIIFLEQWWLNLTVHLIQLFLHNYMTLFYVILAHKGFFQVHSSEKEKNSRLLTRKY